MNECYSRQTNYCQKNYFFYPYAKKKKLKISTMISAEVLAPPQHPLFSVSMGRIESPIKHSCCQHHRSSPTTLTISSHPKCSACVSTARSHACVHVHPSMHTQRATLMSIQLLARLPGTPAKPGERLRAAAARGSRRDARPPPPPRAIRPRRGPTTTSAPLRRPAPSPAGLRQHPLEEEVPLLPEA
jgi:hypothetical protein